MNFMLCFLLFDEEYLQQALGLFRFNLLNFIKNNFYWLADQQIDGQILNEEVIPPSIFTCQSEPKRLSLDSELLLHVLNVF